MEEANKQTVDSKYIQQHLANERTYLAWVRTCVTIMGVGFLITNLHFSTLASKDEFIDQLAKMIGLSSIFVGIITLILTTLLYFRKGNDINNQTFKFSRVFVIVLTILITLIFVIFGVYYVVAWRLI